MEDSLEELVEKCTAQKVTVRLPAYRLLIQKCTESENVVWSDYASEDDTQKTLSNLKSDLFHENSDVCYEAAGLCGCLLASDSFRSLLTKENEVQALDILIKAVAETKEKKVLTRTLWSLAKSRLASTVYAEKLNKILENLHNVLKAEEGSSVIALEALQVIESLLKLIPEEMKAETMTWFPVVFVFLFHDAARVRAVALSCISIGKLFLDREDDLKSDIIKLLISDIKSKHTKTMNKLIGAECADVLKEWRLLVEILGKELHPGTSLINGLLEVVEKGFKSVKAEIRIEAFRCWQSLIDNFALDETVLTHPKRLKLLLAPLKANNAKTEDIALAKLLAWWHLLCKLGKKAANNFDLVIAPLLRFCFGCGTPAGGAASGLSERNLIMSGAAASPGRKFSGLHITCAEILGQIISAGLNISGLQAFAFTTPILEYPVIPSQVVFIRNYQLLMSCVKEAVQSLNSQERKQYLLGIFLFQSVLAQLRVVITTDVSKKESVDPVKEVFAVISALESHCRPGDSQSQFVYKFLEMVIVGSLALPKSVLNSRQYHISTGNTMRDMMSGTLSNYLIRELCKPTLLHYATMREGYFTMWLTVLANSKPATGKLGLLQSVVKELDSAAPILCPANPNTLTRLWSSVVNQLLQHIEETQMIDQGDGSEHDWSCIYSVLMFPLRHSVDALNSAENHVYHQIMKDWSELWHKFTELTPLSATAEPNSEVEYIMHALVSMCTEKLTAPPDVYASTYGLMADVAAVLTEKLRYSELGKTPARLIHSPAKPRKKPHALHNLAGSVALIGILMSRVLRMVSNQRQHAAIRLCEALTQIFKGVHQEKIVNSLISHVADTLAAALQVNPAAKFGVEVEKKFILMFKSFGSLIDEYLGKNYTSDQFMKLISLLSVALSSTNKHIKQEGKRIWRNNFASTKLDIPSDFFDILKECGLPPANLIDDNDDSEESLSFSPKENVPTHIAGSFLNRERDGILKITPKDKNQKQDTPKSQKTNQGTPITKDKSKRRINLEDMNDEEFVKITSPKPSRRVLTEHQIERMMERRSDIPALYNDLSQSQTVLPIQFSSQNSIEGSTPSTTANLNNTNCKIDEIEDAPKKEKEKVREKKDQEETNIEELSFSGIFSSGKKEAESKSTEHEKKSERVSKQKEPEKMGSKSMTGEEKSRKDETKSKTKAEASKMEQEKARKPESETKGKVEENKMEQVEKDRKEGSKINPKAEENKAVEESSECEEEMEVEENKVEQKSGAKTTRKSKMSGQVAKTRSKNKDIANKEETSISEVIESKETLAKKEVTKPVQRNESKRKNDSKRRYVGGESDYTDEDLDEELRRTSIELQKSLDSVSEEPSNELSRRKSQTPVKKTVEDVRKSLKGKGLKNNSSESTPITVPISPSVVHKRINFKEVAVSPSVVKDCRIVSQIPEVKLVNRASALSTKTKLLSESESEEEIPNSQIEESKENLFVFSLISKEKENTPGKGTVTDKGNEVSRGRKVLRAKRKRGATDQDNEELTNPDKRKRTSANNPQSSSEDSVIVIEEPTSGVDENIKQRDESEDIKNIEKAGRRMKKTRSQSDTSRKSLSSQGSQNSENGLEMENLPTTPPKVTRSGRKVVAPNKDMPEPMTPPGNASQKRKTKSQESLTVSYVGDDVPKVTEKLNALSPKKAVPSVRRSVQKKITEMFVKEDADNQDSENEYECLPEMEDIDADSLHPVSDSENDDTTYDNEVSATKETPGEQALDQKHPESDVEVEKKKISEDDLFDVSCVEIQPEIEEDKVENEDDSENELEVEILNIETKIPQSSDGTNMNKVKVDDKAAQDADEDENDSDSCADVNKDEGNDQPLLSSNDTETDKSESDQVMPQSKELESQKNKENTFEEPQSSFENGQILDEEMKEMEKEEIHSKEKSGDKLSADTVDTINNPKQQEEELSPEKPQRSKLSTAVGTPERQKKFGALKCAGSRAAMLVACAKQNMKNRGTSEGESPTKTMFASDNARNRLGGSPSRRSAPGRMSPANTPPNRKRKLIDSENGRPWVKHEPSPGASPSTSILKKPALEEVCNDTPSPPPSKQRRVSFADPPVSDRVEIPPSPKTLRGLRAQKRLDMTKAASPMKDEESQSQSQSESQEGESQILLDCSQPLYPGLVNSTDSLDEVISQLTSPGLTDGLKKVLEDLGVMTVGQFCQLTEADVGKLPVCAPKIANTVKVLKKFDDSKLREMKKNTDPIFDEVDAQLSRIFEDDREDKENQRPNNQAKAKKNVEEVSVVTGEDEIVGDLETEEDNESSLKGSSDRSSKLVEDLGLEEDITPLDPSPDAVGNEYEAVNTICKQITEDPSVIEKLTEKLDMEAKKNLFSSLLNNLKYPFVIDCYHEYLKNRESVSNT